MYQGRIVGAARALLRRLPLNLGHLVLLEPWVKPVQMALRAHEAHPESGAIPVSQDLWGLLDQLDRRGLLAPEVYRDLRARLVRLEFQALTGTVVSQGQTGDSGLVVHRVRPVLRVVREPLEQPAPLVLTEIQVQQALLELQDLREKVGKQGLQPRPDRTT